jgi:hypothetical protein
MKSSSAFIRKAILVGATAAGLILGATGKAAAHDGQWDTRHHYYRDNYGYWDDHDRYRHYIYWHEHHGYWDDRSGVRVFINVD